VATFIAECISDPTKADQEHLVGGPDTFTFPEIGMLAAEVIGRPNTLKIKTTPICSLRLAAALASAAGLIFRGRRRSAAMLHWMIWSGTHDAVAPAFSPPPLSLIQISSIRSAS
jgi:hypothetical protein